MKIRLDQVDESFVWQETLEVSTAGLELPELVEIGAVECRGKIRLMVESYLLHAELSYPQKLRCMRCLKPFTVPFSSQLDLILEVGSGEAPDRERELEQDDLGLLRLEDAILDTRPILTEQVHLSIPMKPLCKEDCAGLCAECGADLNSGSCECETASDPRWQALAALKRKE